MVSSTEKIKAKQKKTKQTVWGKLQIKRDLRVDRYLNSITQNKNKQKILIGQQEKLNTDWILIILRNYYRMEGCNVIVVALLLRGEI